MKINLQLFAPVKVLARGWKVEIQKVDLTWVQILGLSSLTFDGEKKDADTSTFDDAGWESHQVASRGRSLKLEGFYLEDQVTKERDPGQTLVEALADAMGQESLGDFRTTSPAGTVKHFKASVAVSGVGGGNNDPTGWKADLTVSGPLSNPVVNPVSISVPETLAVAVGAVSSVIVTTFTPNTTTDRTLTYTSSAPTKAAVTPEGRVVGISAGTATVTVTGAGGASDTIAVTVT
jgi:hypothetical protein